MSAFSGKVMAHSPEDAVLGEGDVRGNLIGITCLSIDMISRAVISLMARRELTEVACKTSALKGLDSFASSEVCRQQTLLSPQRSSERTSTKCSAFPALFKSVHNC